jgi:O-antigen/teichoic acid export membrane protein
MWSLLEGCNQVANVYTFRFIQGLFLQISIWIAILSGAGLWAASISTFFGLVAGAVLIVWRYRIFLKTLFLQRPRGARISWRDELLPMQWRIAVSWLSGYFTFSLFTPILFQYAGPVAAGQMGMTWSLVSVVSALSSAWVNPKMPRFGILIAQRKYAELDMFFWRVMKVVALVAGGAAFTLWLLVYSLQILVPGLASRMLPPLPTGLFLLGVAFMSALLPMAAYMRAHRKEPLLGLAITGACLVTMSNLIFGRYFAALGMVAGYLSINLVLLPFVVVIWYRFRKAYRCQNPMDAGPASQR